MCLACHEKWQEQSSCFLARITSLHYNTDEGGANQNRKSGESTTGLWVKFYLAVSSNFLLTRQSRKLLLDVLFSSWRVKNVRGTTPGYRHFMLNIFALSDLLLILWNYIHQSVWLSWLESPHLERYDTTIRTNGFRFPSSSLIDLAVGFFGNDWHWSWGETISGSFKIINS